MSQPDAFLLSLVERFQRPGVIGLAVTGSYSRGAQDRYSDVDLDIFVNELPKEDYTLRIFDGKLVSIKYIRLADEFSSLSKPESAIWSVQGLRQMRILWDESGEIHRLQQVAFDFKWEALQPAADAYAVEQLMGCAEEAQKIMGGLLKGNESKVLYASWGMFKSLSFAAATQAGRMIDSENRIFSMMEEHFKDSHPGWVRAFRLAFGMDVEAGQPAFVTRGLASLDLYEETARLFKGIITADHREVIENTLQLIASFKQSYPHA